MTLRTIEELRRDSEALALYAQGMSLLHRSGILDNLREIGRVRVVNPETPNFVDCQAAQANWSIGYNDCLDDLLLFVNRFIEPQTTTMPSMDYQAIERAVARGDLTEKEADGLRKSGINSITAVSGS